VPALRVVAHRADQNVAACFGQVECFPAQQGVSVAKYSVKRDNQRGFLVFRHFGGDEQRVREIFVGIREVILSLLHARVGTFCSSAFWSSSSGRLPLRGRRLEQSKAHGQRHSHRTQGRDFLK